MKGIHGTSSETFRQLFGNGLIYVVPKFQRDYSWEVEQWDDLWQDLEAVFSEDQEHYLGYLVLQTSDNRKFEVIDGQQRLTTLSILILATLKILKGFEEKSVDSENNRKRRESLQASYIGYLDPVTLISRNKLQLNRNNDDFYRTYLATLEQIPKRGLNNSEKRMRACFEWFTKCLNEKFKSGEEFANFIDKIVDKIFFTVIKVSDELNAFKVFETLNARGVQLSSVDLLKNYLFSVLDSQGTHNTELDELENIWSKTIGTLKGENFAEFLRVYWSGRNKITRSSELFKAVKQAIKNKKDVFDLARNLQRQADVYVALRNPEDELWKPKPEMSKQLEKLKLFGVKQPLSLLLIAYDLLLSSSQETEQEKIFIKILKCCVVVSFRYNIIGGLNPNILEKGYNDISRKLCEGETFSAKFFKEIYPDDERFQLDFENISFKYTPRDKRIIRYILGELENSALGESIDPLLEKLSIEHILPENLTSEWKFSEEEHERCLYRLGNLTLLETSQNRTIGNSDFAKKRAAYQASGVKLTKKIAEEYSEWTEETIVKRQKWMAKQAKAAWRLDM